MTYTTAGGIIIVSADLAERRTLQDLIMTLDLGPISIGGNVFWHHFDRLLPCLV
jgi:hypothetical protein